MKNEMIISVLIATLLFLVLPAVSAHIDIIDIGTGYDMIEHYGYVDYQNIANHTIGGAILVFVDGNIVAGKIINMKIRYVGGRKCSPIKTLEYPIAEAEGEHIIAVYIYSMNSSVEWMYVYTAEGVDEVIGAEESETEEDWLRCSWECEE